MKLLEKIKKNKNNHEILDKISLDAIRISIESCNCPKATLCDICKDLLEYYKWKREEKKEHLDNACKWLMHQIMLIFYGAKYKEKNLHFSRDIYTMKEIVELYDEYLSEINNNGDSIEL